LQPFLNENLNYHDTFQNYDCIIGNTHFPKIARTAKIIISQITQPGKFSGVSTIIRNIAEFYKNIAG
jgi:hypothetical protein